MENKKYNYTELPEHVNLVKEYIRTTYPEEYNNFEEKLFAMTRSGGANWVKKIRFANALYNFGIKIAKDPILSQKTRKYMLTNILSFSPTVDIKKEPFKDIILEAMNDDSAQEKFQPIAEAVENEFNLVDVDVAYAHKPKYKQLIFNNPKVINYVKQVAPNESYHIIEPENQQELANTMKYLQLCNAYTAMTERDYIKATSQNI